MRHLREFDLVAPDFRLQLLRALVKPGCPDRLRAQGLPDRAAAQLRQLLLALRQGRLQLRQTPLQGLGVIASRHTVRRREPLADGLL
ncbi:MAG: hypothetical protein EBY24_12465 [Betaproteobacteria bacterium]|nr:hypothetical protein [Betaproteobacteria bacterium]